jgi:isopentenyl diphosphate isomerase/L-lactate dehydrogenase-like FMN-dependent dehydrogenase
MALAAAGPLGVAHCIRLIVEEFAVAMALTGTRSPTGIDSDLIWRG